jgi:hypothetical protein
MQFVHATDPAFRPDPITQDEAAAMFLAALNLFGKWELTDDHAAILLGIPLPSYLRWKRGESGHLSREMRARLSNLVGIHKALRTIFSKASRGYAWIRAANDAFGGSSALDVMLRGELNDIMQVRRYLHADNVMLSAY